LQFHPEVVHTQSGKRCWLIPLNIADAKILVYESFVNHAVEKSASSGRRKISWSSGGVDSSSLPFTAQDIGKQLTVSLSITAYCEKVRPRALLKVKKFAN